MKVLVQKFGGTSVRDNQAEAIQHIEAALQTGNKVVVVVSAIGRHPDPYATDSLLGLIGLPGETHISKREKDLLLSCGEVISSVVFSNALNAKGIRSAALTGAQAGFITNEDFTAAKIKEMRVERIWKELEAHDVVVVAGFQGMTEDGEITTIGRGGSDTSAAALGAALQAEYIDIFTDVEGIMTADPRVVEEARMLDVVTYTEICNLAYQGAKVVHPRAVEIAMQAKVQMRVRSTGSLSEGTLVTSSRDNFAGKDIPDRLITGIAHLAGISQIKIETDTDAYKTQSSVFKAMAEANISVDFINISPNGVVYTIAAEQVMLAQDILRELGLEPKVINNCAKVSLVGAGMTGIPGVTAKIVQTLTDKEIDILQSADSHTTIWVLIKEKDLVAAVNALHATFELSL
ncbi:aspartate kinase [Terribacillus saccharophilus]|uniref:Aspartokinase n=1 Tax=Terribacillus saccharophilus TaxID=361277 RepID=A0A268HCS7_9BACI|nr:aspartate kinase [Terribacillus saccharophilus]PAE07661.1 aspartate kinase [Terribacillus saccharophilus]